MSEKNKIFKEYLVLIEENENIIHSRMDTDANTGYKPLLMLLCFVFLILTFISVIFVGLLILYFSLMWLKLYFRNNQEVYPNYIITDRKFIINKTEINYNEIYDLKHDRLNKNLIIATSRKAIILPDNSPGHNPEFNIHHTLDISNISEEDVEKIIERWFKSSPFRGMNFQFEKFAKKYNLRHTPYSLSQRNTSLKGKINDLDFSLAIYGRTNFSQLHIHLNCPNSEDNYFSIRREKFSDGFSKMAGMDDYLVNDSILDKAYIFQTNHIPFLQAILQEGIQQSLKKFTSKLNGELRMGIKQKEEKKTKSPKRKQDSNLLDDHLIGLDTPSIRQKKEGLKRLMIFDSSHLNYEKDIERIARDIITYTEMMISMAENIKHYNDSDSQ